ncbi:hypothetical protein Taro_014592 [Colocasia esculenta]|uniref:Secreted protein n=1 Tax=Colocasia esculenta TaxID=4460 RepID=A0A843UF85_COLES|nr:hypothetical protein [Colocasia esculenta]
MVAVAVAWLICCDGGSRCFQWHRRVCSSMTSWHVQGPGWFCLWALDLVEVRGIRASGVTSVSRGCSVFLVVHAEGCFRIVFDSACSAGVISGPTLVVGRGRDSLSQEFVAGWLWWRFVVSCVASSVSCEREHSFRREFRVTFLHVLRVYDIYHKGTICVTDHVVEAR